ncbi:glycosyltransferase [Rheinheimera sp. UJ63]|uniref:glycosyltransferase n=1 Tax=Rheinheimera sp. UJ63 TaxID=2910157 RepID=UPI001F23C127|nr:glycosyltransferase [Rheinheimera sp. UJ63]MCF4009282.1 glycosyltransferase [Rheinheimera sp. UJ63]
MSKKKLVFVTNIIPHYNEFFFNSISMKLCNEYDVYVIADTDSDEDVFTLKKSNRKYELINIPFYSFYNFYYRTGLVNTIKQIKADKVVLYANPKDISIWFLLFYLKLSGIWAASYGMFHRIGGMNIFSRTAYKLFGFFSAKLFCYSRRGALTLESIGVDNSKINIIGTAIDNDSEIVEISQIEKDDFIRNNHLYKASVILQVVRLSSYKNPGFVIDVAQEMLKKNSNIVFVLIGGGELFDDLNSRVKFLGLESNIKLLGPCYDKKVLSLWFSVAKISVVPTCIGLSAHHSLGFGVPVMTDDSIVNQASEFDILQHGLNAIIYREGDLSDFVSKLEAYLDDVDHQLFMSEASVNTIRYNANIQSKVNNFINALN